MYFATEEDYAQSFGTVGADSPVLQSMPFTPGPGEYFTTHMEQAFDRTSGVRAYEGATTLYREGKARDENTLTEFASEAEYKASEHYRKGIAFEPGMTNVRARIYAENYDKRRAREIILQAGSENGDWWYGLVGFGGGVIGSLPDPINCIPFAGGAVKGTQLAGMTAKQVAASSLAKGALEGAAGNLVSSGIAAWDLNAKGERISTQDVFLDTMFGAVAGPLFHGAGAFVGRAKARADMRADMGTLHGMTPEGSPIHTQLGESLEGMRQNDAAAYAQSAPMLDVLNTEGAIRLLRENSSRTDRLEIARAMEFSIGEVLDGRPLDISPILRETAALGRAWDTVKAEIDARTPAGEPGEVLVLLEPVGQDSLGMQRGPMAIGPKGEPLATGAQVNRPPAPITATG